jgi:hypothetical protein
MILVKKEIILYFLRKHLRCFCFGNKKKPLPFLDDKGFVGEEFIFLNQCQIQYLLHRFHITHFQSFNITWIDFNYVFFVLCAHNYFADS